MMQSGFAQDFLATLDAARDGEGPTTVFHWLRNQPCWIETGSDNEEYVVAKGECEKYEPLREEPNLWLHFSRLMEPGQRRRSNAENKTRILDFVSRYGIPTEHYSELPAGTNILNSYRERRLRLKEFLRIAAEIIVPVRFLAAVSMAEQDDDWSGLDGLSIEEVRSPESRLFGAKAALATAINEQLFGRVFVLAHPEPTPPRLESRLWPADLLAAMWLQLLDAATGKHVIRNKCAGCGNPFLAKDKRQRYCDPSCRHAANQRAFYQRQKERSDGEEG